MLSLVNCSNVSHGNNSPQPKFQQKPADISSIPKDFCYVLVSQTVAKSFGKNPKTRFFHFLGPSRLGWRLPTRQGIWKHTLPSAMLLVAFMTLGVKNDGKSRCFRWHQQNLCFGTMAMSFLEITAFTIIYKKTCSHSRVLHCICSIVVYPLN